MRCGTPQALLADVNIVVAATTCSRRGWTQSQCRRKPEAQKSKPELIQSVMTVQPKHDTQAKFTSSNLQRSTTIRACVGIESDPTTLGRNAGLGPPPP